LTPGGAAAEPLGLAAVTADPLSPIYLQTLAPAYQTQRRDGDAEQAYARAVAGDPTLFPAHNDRGVLLARAGRAGESAESFRRAVGATTGTRWAGSTSACNCPQWARPTCWRRRALGVVPLGVAVLLLSGLI
jgi:Tfp pilus assembly protein PilF